MMQACLACLMHLAICLWCFEQVCLGGIEWGAGREIRFVLGEDSSTLADEVAQQGLILNDETRMCIEIPNN